MNSITIDYYSDEYRTIEKTTLESIKDGLNVTISLDYVPSFEKEDLRQLITLLRRCRDIGGEFAVRASRHDVRRVLAVTALDRVFTVVGAAA